ncbi:Uncharacterized conserved protein [Novosphingobium sp. B1]|nr:Uncharacterized conserved protein [Novosphingobium sp. B1]
MCTPMASTAAWATDVDAGDYVALPPGSNLAIVYAQFAERDAIYAKGDKQPGDPGLDSTVFILRGVHYMDIAGLTVDPQFLLPLGQLEGKGDTHALGKSGGAAGDLILAATVWLVNKPKSNTYFGITPFVYVPTGSYDRTRPLNLGENRWKFVLQGGFVKGVTPKISIDLVGDVTFYGKNNDFGSSSARLTQSASGQFQAFARYQLKPNLDFRVGGSFVTGGETRIDGIRQQDQASNWKGNVGMAWFPAKTVQLLATYGRDISVRSGFRESNRLNLRLLKVF